MTITLTYSREQIDRALALGHQHSGDARISTDARRAAPCPVREPALTRPEQGERARAALNKRVQRAVLAKFHSKADKRNRRRVDKEVEAASDLPEQHPELTAQTIHGCQVFFCEDEGPPESVAQWWNMIAGGVYA